MPITQGKRHEPNTTKNTRTATETPYQDTAYDSGNGEAPDRTLRSPGFDRRPSGHQAIDLDSTNSRKCGDLVALFSFALSTQSKIPATVERPGGGLYSLFLCLFVQPYQRLKSVLTLCHKIARSVNN